MTNDERRTAAAFHSAFRIPHSALPSCLLLYLRLGHHRPHLEDGDDGQEAYEEQQEEEEEADGSEEHREVEEGRRVGAPGGGQEVPVQAHGDDDEALKPHADVDEHRDDEEHHVAVAHAPNPDELRDDDVADQQRPVEEGVRPEEAVHDHELFVGVRAVPRRERLHHVAVADDEARREHHLRGVAEVALGYEVFEPVELAERYQQRQHHREARVDGARDEVGREDGRVPARYDADGEVEADDGVDREHERRREPREQKVHGLVARPVPCAAAPAQGGHAEDHAPEARARAVAQGRQVGYEPREPEERRDGRVGRDGEHVPHQGATELRLYPHRVRVGEEPVGEPRPPGVKERVESRARDGEERHRLGEAVDRSSPGLSEQQQDGRDERARVADAYPPDEVGDVERPPDRLVVAPDAYALYDEPGDGAHQHVHHHEGDGDADPPPDGSAPALDEGAYLVRDRRERVARLYDHGRRVYAAGVVVVRVVSLHESSLSLPFLAAREGLVGVAHGGQVARARPRVQVGEQVVAALLRVQLRHAARGVIQVAEDDRLGRAGRLARGLYLAVAHAARRRLFPFRLY